MKTNLKGRSLIEPGDFSIAETEGLFELAEMAERGDERLRDACRGKLLATLFFEPSTRTRLSFEAAMMRLGGCCLGFADSGSSSASKGESLADTVRMAAAYADVIVMRSPKEGAALLASRYSDAPVLNAGDGGHHHPTQTLTDLYTIRRLRGEIGNITVGFCGDLKFGRTVHSLAKALARRKNIRAVFISPEELAIPGYISSEMKKNGVEFSETKSLEKAMPELDVLYMTRVQRERFFNEEDYLRLKDSFVLNAEKMKPAKKDLIVMHPLPRVSEIAPEVDSDPRAAYFRQAKFGMYARMGLLAAVLGAA